MEVLYEKELVSLLPNRLIPHTHAIQAWIDRMRNRPIMSGGYLRPSINNRPLPRFYRQPIHITMMIRSRVVSAMRRLERQTKLMAWLDDLKAEEVLHSTLWKQGVYASENEIENMAPYGTF